MAFVQQSSSCRSPVLKKSFTNCRCQTLTTVREPFSSQFPSSSIGQINEECLLCNVASWDSLSLADTSDLVLGRLFCCCCVMASRNPVFIRNHIACSSSQQERAEHWTIFGVLEEFKHLCYGTVVQCLASLANWWGIRAAVQFMLITSTEEKFHKCRCQTVTTVREPFSSQFPSSPKFRSVKSVTFAILKAETAWVWQTPPPLCD